MKALCLALALLPAAVLAQPQALLKYQQFRLSYSYTVQTEAHEDKQQARYFMSANGDVVLTWDGDTHGEKRFIGKPNVPTVLRYDGTVVDSSGCGMQETVVGMGFSACDSPTRFTLGKDDWGVEPNCENAPVVHTFQWLGPCGPLFPYPEDPLVRWRWHADDVAPNAPVNTRFSYPQDENATLLEGSYVGTQAALLSPLWTWLATGTMAPARYDISYALTPLDPEDLVLELDDTAPAYRDWRPSAHLPSQHGSPLELTARLYSKTGKTPSSPIDRVTWQLEDTSREPGIAINAPLDATDTAFDLRLHSTTGTNVILSDDEQRIVRVRPEGFTDTMQVVPYDWGGWGRLKVTAVLVDGRSFVVIVKSSGASRLLLPRRQEDSYVVESWKSEKGVSGRDDLDEEETTGDGLTLYEEYRGFYQDQFHASGEPKKRDFFINNRAGSEAKPAIGSFAGVSQFEVHGRMRDGELTAARVVNGNHDRGAHEVDQHGVIIETSWYHVFEAEAVGGPATPRYISRVELPAGWWNFSEALKVKVVAHELLHCANVYHHGDGDELRLWQASGPLLLEGGRQVHVQEDPSLMDVTRKYLGRATQVTVGLDRGEHSGEESCLMRYFTADAYVAKADPTLRYAVKESIGVGLCHSGAGTGVNGSHSPQPRYGDAASNRGNCFQQRLVNDARPPPPR